MGSKPTFFSDLWRLLFVLGTLWTLGIAASLAVTIARTRAESVENARAEAVGAFNKDLAYLRWVAQKGGVYIEVSESTPPNPYLKHLDSRDVTTQTGVKLTLLNPAYMTRQVHELARMQYGFRGHITSLRPLRPANAPDPWERKALEAFERGAPEWTSIEEIDSEDFLRFMGPMFTEGACLKCHAAQGYEVGDIHGGISVSVPMALYRAMATRTANAFAAGAGVIWLLGLFGISLAARGSARSKRLNRASEKTLRRARDQAQMYLDVAAVMLLVLDTDGRISTVNKRGCEILGSATEAELIGLDWFENFLPRESHGEMRAVFEKLIDGNMKGTGYYENTIVTRKGERREIAWNNTRLVDESGRCVGLLSSAEDITECRREKDAATRLGHIIERSLNEIYVFDATSLRFVEVNLGARENLGYSMDELREMTPLDIKPQHTTDSFAKLLKPLRCGERATVVFNTLHRRKDGSQYPVEVHLQRMVQVDQDVFVAVILDRSERQKLEEQLIQAQKMEAVGTLAGGVAHDMNNVLAVVLGFGSIIKDEMGPNDPKLRDIQAIISAAQRGKSLVENLLGFARKGAYNKQVISPNNTIRELVGVLSRSISKKITISTELDDRLANVECDAAQLMQTLLNLCLNANDALDGVGTITICTRNETLSPGDVGELEAGQYVKIQVRDDGPGMDEQTRKKAFEPFFTTKDVGKGTGLGLSMAYGVVQNHGGAIQIDSSPGEGATINIWLPATAQQEFQKTEVVHEASRPDLKRRKARVLLVDDEEMIREMAERMLEALGYEVILADSGPLALDLYRDRGKQIDLVLLDLSMPVMDGFECFERLKKLDADVRVIICTGRGNTADTEEMIRNGASSVVTKPFGKEQLSEAIARTLLGAADGSV